MLSERVEEMLEEKTVYEIALARENELQAAVPEGMVLYSISDRIRLVIPLRFLDPVTQKILVLPVTLENGLTYEAVNAIQYLSVEPFPDTNDWQLHTKEMFFNELLYNEIKSFFERILSVHAFIQDEEGRLEEEILTTLATGLAQEDRLFFDIMRWCSEKNLEIQHALLLPELYPVDYSEKVNFHHVIDLPHELYDQEIICCTYDNLVQLSKKLYTAPVLGFLGSIYSVVGVSDQAWAFGYSSTFGFMLGSASRLVRCDGIGGALFVGTMSAASAAGVTALKYVLNNQDVLTFSATATVGIPLIIYAVERIAAQYTAGNRFSLWRAVPATPESHSSQSSVENGTEMVVPHRLSL